MRSQVLSPGLAFVLASVAATSCFGEPPIGDHPCNDCLPCETCMLHGTDEPACVAEEHHHSACGVDGHVHWYDSCDADEGIKAECNNATCTVTSATEATCECDNHWQGSDCEICPGNWDPTQDCAVCQNHWIDEGDDCGTCPDNWDPYQECNACANHWIDEDNDCGTCPGNWDPEQDCIACVGNWDPSENCEECEFNWVDEGNDCGTCPGNWDPDASCADCLGQWDLATACTECMENWLDDDDDCATYQYLADFELDADGFTHTHLSGGSGQDPWERGESTSGQSCHAGSCFGTNLDGYYPDCQDAALVSPAIDLSWFADAPQTPELTFWHWYNIEPFNADTWWDGALVQLSDSDGVSWHNADPTPSYDGLLSDDPDPYEDCADVAYVAGRSAWAGDISGNAWTQVTVPIDDEFYVEEFRFRFVFGSDVNVVDHGWLIDDIEIRLAD